MKLPWGVSFTDVLPPGPTTPRLLQAVEWGLRYPQFTQRARARYGPTFTVRPGTVPPAVITTDPDAIRHLLTGDPRKRAHGNEVVRPLLGDRSIFLLEPSEHLERRKLLLPPFHGESVRRYAELMRALTEDAVAGWRPGEVVAVLPVALNVTIEVILQAVLGVRDAQTRREFRRLIDDLLYYPLGSLRLRIAARIGGRLTLPAPMRAAAAFAAALPTPAVATYFPNLKERTWRNPTTLRWWGLRDRLVALLDRHIAATRADAALAGREDILAMLVREGGLSDADLREDLIALISAGHETTASTTAWGAVLLAHDSEVRERAAQAARDGDDAYLGALVKEVLRLRPAVPLGGARVLDEPVTIGEWTIPAGTVIGVDAWNLHREPSRYPDPERFSPERFLDAGAGGQYGWLPFGGGAHRCLGAALAELEVRVALSTILRGVRFGPAERTLPPTARRGIVFVPHGGGRIRIEARYSGVT